MSLRTFATAILLTGLVSPQAQAAPCFNWGALKKLFTVQSFQEAMDPCCREIPFQAGEHRGIAPNSMKDPYFTGSVTGSDLPSSAMLRFEAPPVLKSGPLPIQDIEIPNVTEEARLESFIRDHAPGSVTQEAGSGGTSKVWFLAPPPPPDMPPETLKSWIRANATQVVKVRTLTPFSSRRNDIRLAAEAVRRDLGMYGLAQQLTNAAKFQDQPFIRVAKLQSSPEQLRSGILVQEAIHGPNAALLKNSLDILSASTPQNPTHVRQARQIFRDMGLDPANAQDLEKAREQISALERFFRMSHASATLFQGENQIKPVMNYARNAQVRGDNVPVGLDYNHGQNVVWDPKTRMWVMIDW